MLLEDVIESTRMPTCSNFSGRWRSSVAVTLTRSRYQTEHWQLHTSNAEKQELQESLPKNHIVIMMSNLNSKVGSDNTSLGYVIGKYRLEWSWWQWWRVCGPLQLIGHTLFPPFLVSNVYLIRATILRSAVNFEAGLSCDLSCQGGGGGEKKVTI